MNFHFSRKLVYPHNLFIQEEHGGGILELGEDAGDARALAAAIGATERHDVTARLAHDAAGGVTTAKVERVAREGVIYACPPCLRCFICSRKAA